MSHISPIKLKIRQDEEEGVIRAWLAMDDGSHEVEVSTVSLTVCRNDPQAFQEWKTFVVGIMTRFIEGTCGIPIERIDTFKPHESN